MALAERTAQVQWTGTLADGSGTVKAGSGAVSDLALDWASDSASADGTTSPEELLAAAHAGCYAMALALLLARQGNRAERLDVGATCALEERGDWYAITAIDLHVTGTVPGLDGAAFEQAAEEADEHCPISIALRDRVEIRVKATLA
jgi:osmotically inducible protein OsmC